MLTNPSSPASYNTIEEIQPRKSLLQKDMLKDDGKIRNQWHSLFSPPAALSKNASRAKRINSLLNTGAGLFDAFMLGWKLYRKFKR